MPAHESRSATSYQSGIGGRGVRCTKSVTMYGAFGRNRSQMMAQKNRAAVARVVTTSAAAMAGITARRRFQARNANVS